MPSDVKYFDLQHEKRILQEIEAQKNKPQTRYVDFFLQRKREEPKIVLPKRHHIGEDYVAEVTEKSLLNIAEGYHRQLDAWRPDQKFRHVPQVKILDDYAHLGYAAITQGTIPDKDEQDRAWILYFANFNAKFGTGDALFVDVEKSYGVTFFALALQLDEQSIIKGRDMRVRGNGVMFSTKDPAEAFESVVKLRDVQKIWAEVVRDRDAEPATQKPKRLMKTYAKPDKAGLLDNDVVLPDDRPNLLLIV